MNRLLIPARVEDMFNLFAQIFPIKATKAQEKAIQKSFGMTLKEFVEAIFINLGHDCAKPENQENAEGYFDWISQAILYMKGERDELPDMQIDYDFKDKAETSIQ